MGGTYIINVKRCQRPTPFCVTISQPSVWLDFKLKIRESKVYYFYTLEIPITWGPLQLFSLGKVIIVPIISTMQTLKNNVLDHKI